MMVEIPFWYVEYFWAFLALGIFELVLKAFALWHSARGRQIAWFVCLLVLNTAGILPIIYLLFFKKKEKSSSLSKKRRR